MPSTYAHQHFGNLVFDKLPEKLQEEIAPYRGLYNIGLQGPDIFFYYKPLLAIFVYVSLRSQKRHKGRSFVNIRPMVFCF